MANIFGDCSEHRAGARIQQYRLIADETAFLISKVVPLRPVITGESFHRFPIHSWLASSNCVADVSCLNRRQIVFWEDQWRFLDLCNRETERRQWENPQKIGQVSRPGAGRGRRRHRTGFARASGAVNGSVGGRATPKRAKSV